MSLGFKSDHQDHALHMFAMGLKYMARACPENARLQAYSRKVCLTYIMLATKEIQELRSNGNTLRDRQQDCAECRRMNGKAPGQEPCARDGHWGIGPCIYSSPEWAMKFIEQQFGEEGLGALEALGEWTEKELEAMSNAGENTHQSADG